MSKEAGIGGTSRQSTEVVAVTGASGVLGRNLLHRMVCNDRYRRIVALDLKKPPLRHERIVYHHVDLTDPGSYDLISTCLKSESVDTLVHLAFLSEPTPRLAWAHELEVIGTLRLFDACAALRVRKVIMLSTTCCYGPHPDNPNYLTEEQPLRGLPSCGYLNDKIEAERQLDRYKKDNPRTVVTCLRMAPLIGPSSRNWVSKYFSLPAPITLAGHDPLVQLLHESDAVEALTLALEKDVPGTFNVVPEGVLPLSEVFSICERRPVPLPESLARPWVSALWLGQILRLPPAMLAFARYLCVADCRRAADEMGFAALHSSREAVHDFAAGFRRKRPWTRGFNR